MLKRKRNELSSIGSEPTGVKNRPTKKTKESHPARKTNQPVKLSCSSSTLFSDTLPSLLRKRQLDLNNFRPHFSIKPALTDAPEQQRHNTDNEAIIFAKFNLVMRENSISFIRLLNKYPNYIQKLNTDGVPVLLDMIVKAKHYRWIELLVSEHKKFSSRSNEETLPLLEFDITRCDYDFMEMVANDAEEVRILRNTPLCIAMDGYTDIPPHKVTGKEDFELINILLKNDLVFFDVTSASDLRIYYLLSLVFKEKRLDTIKLCFKNKSIAALFSHPDSELLSVSGFEELLPAETRNDLDYVRELLQLARYYEIEDFVEFIESGKNEVDTENESVLKTEATQPGQGCN